MKIFEVKLRLAAWNDAGEWNKDFHTYSVVAASADEAIFLAQKAGLNLVTTMFDGATDISTELLSVLPLNDNPIILSHAASMEAAAGNV